MKLSTRDLTLSYGDRVAVNDVSLEIDSGEMVAVIGPNGSGKSTLLRGIAGLIKPSSGEVLLDGTNIRDLAARDVARRLAILPQTLDAGLDLTVEELISRGRYPYLGMFRRATAADEEVVEWAIEATAVAELCDRTLDSLSGGERQRAWIALALAQEPELLLLDEPTTFLDIAHQVEVLTLLVRLNRERGITIVMAMHDLPQSAHYADRLIALRDGRVILDGPPATVITAEHVEKLFGVAVTVLRDPATGSPIVAPIAGPAPPPGR